MGSPRGDVLEGQDDPFLRPVFIALAEDTGLIKRLGAYLARAVVRRAARWADRPDFTVWVNVSGRQLDGPGFAQDLLADLAEAGLKPGRVGVEVTESVLVDRDVTVEQFSALREAGVPVAIDDFGTGDSSLARLAALPISVLKIERSLVERIDTPAGRASIDVIVPLARALDLRTVAEGVETERQLELLQEVRAGSAAGYLLGRPGAAVCLDAQDLSRS